MEKEIGETDKREGKGMGEIQRIGEKSKRNGGGGGERDRRE